MTYAAAVPPAITPRTRFAWGMTAMAAALVAQWLLQQAWPTAFFPPLALGDVVIRQTPGDVATNAIEQLGHIARPALAANMGLVLMVATGLAATWRSAAAVTMAAAAALLAAVVAPVEPSMRGAIATAAAGTAGSALAMGLFVTTVRRAQRVQSERRRLLLAGFAGGFVLLAAGAVVGRNRDHVPAGALIPATRLDIQPDPAFPELPGLSARITAPEDHYVVDIDLSRPRIDRDRWRLTVKGAVHERLQLTFDELIALGTEEHAVYLQCISNVFAGDLMSNGLWTCVPLDAVLARAGTSAKAMTVVARGVDGYHEQYAMSQTAEMFVAVGMGGGVVLPDHGYPVRLLFPGHYGVRSLKWLTEIEVIEGDAESYWGDRGWDAEAVLRLGSRIDTPGGGAKLVSPARIGGVAWGPNGVSGVEVSADGGATWRAATLETPLDSTAWRRWYAELNVTPGEHVLISRALSGTAVQDATPRPPHPSGGSGLHRVTVRVS